MREVVIEPQLESWRQQARVLLEGAVPPQEILWQIAGDQSSGEMLPGLSQPSLLREVPTVYLSQKAHRVPKDFMHLAESVACHRSNAQWPLLYQILWRMVHGGEKTVMKNGTDDAVLKLNRMRAAIRRDIHKMRAFVRFRVLKNEHGEHYIAWFEPEHRILRLNTTFFRKRFTGMKWSILTPDECAHWDGERVTFSAGIQKEDVPVDEDALEQLWLAYYRSTFNPARVKIKMMQSEMPKKYWKNLPEAEVIEELIHSSNDRVIEMMERHAQAVKPEPQIAYLEKLRSLNEANNSVDDAPG